MKNGTQRKIDTRLNVMIFTGLMLLSGFSQAEGCLKGAAVGAVAGHVAGHHAVLGAVGGCMVGHHLAKEEAKAKKEKEKAASQPKSAQQTPAI